MLAGIRIRRGVSFGDDAPPCVSVTCHAVGFTALPTSHRCRAPVTPSRNANPSRMVESHRWRASAARRCCPTHQRAERAVALPRPFALPPPRIGRFAPSLPCAVAPRSWRTAPQTAQRASFCRHAPRVASIAHPHNTATIPDLRPIRAGKTVPRQDVPGRCSLSRRWLSVAPTPLRNLSATRPAQRPLRLPRSTHCASAHWRAYPKDGQAHRSHMVSLSACAALSPRRTMWHYVSCRGLVSASGAPVHTYRASRGDTTPARRPTAAKVKR